MALRHADDQPSSVAITENRESGRGHGAIILWKSTGGWLATSAKHAE